MAERTQFGLTLVDEGLTFSAADREALEHVLKQADAYRRRFTYYRDHADWAESLLSERDADVSRDVLVVSNDAGPAAMLELVHDGATTLTIALLVVSDKARTRGIGRRAVEQLIRSIARSAQANDNDAPVIDTLAIGVETTNRQARAFWDRLDFVEVSTIGSGATRIVNMERWLTSGAADAVSL
jgi:ribosomal protein S18 acetylase RimI-like enzyme